MACIYKITNLVNNKVYIGKTLRTAEKRWKEHCKDCQKRKCEQRPLYRAMNKYGIENFICETIEECTIEDINDREVYWIEYYQSYHNGYNATYGGDGKSYADYDLIYQLFKEGKLIREISDITGHDISTIRQGLRNMGISIEEVRTRAIDSIKIPVIMLDKDTGEELKIFDSVTEAEQFIGMKPGGSHIAAVCKGNRATAGGYKWQYAN